MIQKPPIFIVGVPRSGTTLLAAMLAAHRNMSCGPETHFFRWIQRSNTTELISDNNWPTSAVEFICSIIRRSYHNDENPRLLIEKYGITRDEISSYLIQHAPSVAAMLSSITETHMVNMGKTRWVEKTPDHIMHLEDIRKAFPLAPIIRIVRDPRDVAISLSKMPWGVQSFFEGLIYWRKLDNLAQNFFTSDPYAYTLRFEDLIQSPITELKKLCDFLEESFDPNMLDTSGTGKKLNSSHVPWKEKASQPLDQNRIMVWQKEISPNENILAEAYLGDLLDHYGYLQSTELSRFGYAFPADQLDPKYVQELTCIAAMGIRFWPKNDLESPDVLIFLGDPASNEWSRGYGGSIFSNRLFLTLRIIQYKLLKRKVIWVNPDQEKKWTGLPAQVIKGLMASNHLSIHLS